MKKTSIVFLISFFLGLGNWLFSQSISDKLFITIQPEYARILAHHPELKTLSLYNFPNLELNVYKQTTGDAEWEKRWNYPQSGISLYYSALSNKQIFGEAFAIMPFESFTFFRRPKHEQRLMIACGLGYLTKTANKENNPLNYAIGSHLNVSVKFQYSFLYRFTPNFGFSLGTSFGHFSNGATKYPNWGLNVWSFSGGLHLKVNNHPIRYSEPPIFAFKKQWIPYVWGAWGTKQNSQTDPKLYNATSFGGGIARNYKFGKEWMAGADFFWDYTDKIEFNNHLEYPNTLQLFKVGIYGGHEWSMNNVSVAFQTGAYLYQYSYFSERKTDPIYSRVALKYHITKRLQANVSIKAHYARADYIEWGLLYKFKK